MTGVTEFAIGDRVVIRGGFEDGITGVIVADEPKGDGPHRYRVRFKRCPYCGDGACSGSALTANGRDVERWHRIHAPGSHNPGTIGGLHAINLERIEP